MNTYLTTDPPLTRLHSNINQGMVTKKLSGFYTVNLEGQAVTCTLAMALRKLSGKHNDPVSVGDMVQCSFAPDGSAMIEEVLPRRNWLSRRSAVPMPGAHAFEQVIVANVDQIVPVFAAAQPAPKWPLLDRYLVSAEAAEISALVVITKIDLVQSASGALTNEHDLPDWLHEACQIYRQAGYGIILTSAETGAGLEELKTALQGRVSVFLGKSGVGKTSLLNAIQPDLGLRVNQVSQVTGKGKHTTTHLEMFELDFGGSIVDTPGIREFGLWEVDGSDLDYFFPEMRPFLGECRFGLGCAHDEEPGCAVRKAVLDGLISPLRYRSYLNLREENR